jgi:glycosyltransferase involved in cell wall biosynthesis
MSSAAQKILIVTHHYPPHITGVGMAAHNQAKRLAALGYAVTVVTSRTNDREQSGIIDGVKIIRIKALNFSEKWGAPFPLFSPSILPVLKREVKKADIVHIHDAFYMSSFFAAVWARWYKKALVLTQHIAFIVHPRRIVVWIEKMVYVTTGRIVFALSDTIIVYNETVREFLLARHIAAEKIVTLMNGVDGNLFHPVTAEEKTALRTKWGLSKYKKIVLFVGRFVYKKGFTKVLAAQSSKYQIVFAGADALQENTPEAVFLGKMSPADIAEVYQAADIFILPSESEGFPLSIQEAMSCGLPIITTNDPGYAEYSLDKNLVYLIDTPTDQTVQFAIQEIIFDDDRLKKMSEYSVRYANEHFKWDTLIGQLEAIYRHVINPPMPKRKIAFVSDAVYQFNKGGKEKRLYDLTTRLAAQGNQVTIYCMKWWEGPTVIEKEGVVLHAISPYYPLYAHNRRSISQALLFSLHCFALFGQSFDVIDVDHIPHMVLFVTKIVSVLKRKKMIATWHEVWGKKYWQEYLGTVAGAVAYIIERISAGLPDVIISVSPYTTAQLKLVLNVKKKIVTIPNALDSELIQQTQPGPASDILFAGRLLPHKHADILLQSVAMLKKSHPDISVRIVGEGPQKHYLEQLTKELGLEKNVAFMGFVDKQETLYGIMKSSKVFVLPSDREGFGITVIEANAAGLPVVTSTAEHNAAKELIIEGQNGLLSDITSNDLADTIERVLRSRKSPDFYAAFADKYGWKEIIIRLEELYRTI